MGVVTMSKKRRARFSGHSHIVGERNLSREAEIAARPVEAYRGDPVIEALTKRLSSPDCTEVEALNIGLALQGLLRGDAALVNNMDDPKVAEMVAKMRENRAKHDEAAARFEGEREKFVEDVFTQAERIAPVGDKAQSEIAHGMNQYKSAMQKATAKRSERRLRFAWHLENDPKVLINVTPIFERTSVGGVVSEVAQPVVLRIMERTFVLKPGEQMVPRVLADAYERYNRSRQESAEWRKVMANGTVNANDLARKQAAILEKYGTKGQVPNVPPEV